MEGRGRPWGSGTVWLLAGVLLLAGILVGCGGKKESQYEKVKHEVEAEWEELTPAQEQRRLKAANASQRRWERQQRKCPEYAASPKQMPGPAGTEVPSLHVGCGDFGEWPLTVKSGVLQCEEEIVSSLVVQRVTFTTPDGVTYAVNGHALDAGYPDIKPIWKKEPGGYGLRVNIGPLIDRGLRLCEGS